MLTGRDQQRIRGFDHDQVGDADGRDELTRRVNIISASVQQKYSGTLDQVAFWRRLFCRVVLMQSGPRAKIVPTKIGGQAVNVGFLLALG